MTYTTNPSVPDNERMWATIAHLSPFVGYWVFLGHIVAPLVIWLVKRAEMPYLASQAKEALNFQISISLYVLACIPLMFVIIGIPLLIAVVIFDLVMMIVAAVKANNGEAFRYPLCIRFVR